jgi:hypothetical protein
MQRLYQLYISALLGIPAVLAVLAGTWSNRLGLALTPVTTGVWAAERPFLWNGIDVGGRSAIVRMNDGGLLVHSPVAWDDELASAVAGIGGDVKYIVSPNYEHLKYAKQYAETFPSARMYGCPGLGARLPDINWRAELSDQCPAELEDSIDTSCFDCEQNPFTGKPFFNEVVLFHKKSKTLICSDAFWNYPDGKLPNYFGVSGTGRLHECSKVPLPYKEFPPIKRPLGTILWKVWSNIRAGARVICF